MNKFLLAAGLLLIVSGCAAAPVLLRNDKGDLVRCKADGGMALAGGYIATKYQVVKCAEQYEAAGYKQVK